MASTVQSYAKFPTWIVALAAGLVLSPILTATPLLRYVAWFLSSLFHESGHCAMAILTGHSALPAIRLDGHAAATHGPQHTILTWATLIALIVCTWKFRDRRKLAIGLGALALVYPVLAWTSFGKIAFLGSGHLGELAFASYALACATTGGFTSSLAERIAHALLGFWLVGHNFMLFVGLATDSGARAVYASNGSFGMQNDLIRIASYMTTSLEAVAVCFAAVSLLVAPVTLTFAVLYNRRYGD